MSDDHGYSQASRYGNYMLDLPDTRFDDSEKVEVITIICDNCKNAFEDEVDKNEEHVCPYCREIVDDEGAVR